MRWFGRKDADPVPAVIATPEPGPQVDKDYGFVQILDDGSISVTVSTTTEAKHAINQLRLIKKEYGILKQGVAADIAQVKTNRRLKVASQGNLVHGRGDFAKFTRAMQQASRNAAKAGYAKHLAVLEHQKTAVDRQIVKADSLIVQLEQYIMDHPEPEPTKPKRDITHSVCPACQNINAPGDRFCGDCGGPLP